MHDKNAQCTAASTTLAKYSTSGSYTQSYLAEPVEYILDNIDFYTRKRYTTSIFILYCIDFYA